MTAQLPQVLVRNSFNILGLSSSAELKEIRKRSQQLLQLAKIEESQEFDMDIGHVRELRTESEIRLALERVSGIQERLKEIFFWFDDHSIESRKAVALISKQDYQRALDIFDKSHQGNTDWLGCKNLALALIFHAFSDSSFDSFLKSLNLWKLIADSDDFWEFYEKHYLLHDELGTSPSLFEEFRSSIYEILSVKSVAFYLQTKNPEVIGACYSAFGQIGQSIDTEALQPIIFKIKKEMDDLKRLGADLMVCSLGELVDRPVKSPSGIFPAPPGEVGTVVCKKTQEGLIKKSLKKVHKYFLELDKFELVDYSPLIVLRNDSAEKLRSISIDIYNQNCSPEIALLFLDQGAKLAVLDAIVNKIESDKIIIKENQLWKKISFKFDEIKDLIAQRKFEEAKSAYLNLDNELAENDEESSNGIRINLLINYCSQLMGKGHELFDKKMFGVKALAIDGILNWQNHKESIRSFEDALEILTDRLYLLNFINPFSDRVDISKTIEKISSSLKNCEITSLVDYHQANLITIDETANIQENENTQEVIRLLGAAACFSIFYRRFRGIIRRKMWKLIGWASAIAFYFLIIMVTDTESKSSKQSTYRTISSHSTASSQTLTHQEKQIIEYLQKNDPKVLRKIRKEGYSDKQIARYVIEHADDEE